MKPLKITTRETDKLRDEIKELDRLIGHQEGYSDPHNTRGLEAKRAKRIETISTLSAIIDAKRGAIGLALAIVNGRAAAHTINTYAEVWEVADRAEKLLASRGVAKKNRVGTTVAHHPSGPSASAYKYGAISTTITLKRVADGWRLICVSRTTAWPKSPERLHLTISPAAADNISRAAFDRITVRLAAEIAA